MLVLVKEVCKRYKLLYEVAGELNHGDFENRRLSRRMVLCSECHWLPYVVDSIQNDLDSYGGVSRYTFW